MLELDFWGFSVKNTNSAGLDDECSLKRENLAQARFCRSGPMKVRSSEKISLKRENLAQARKSRSSEILAEANLCNSLAFRLELAQARFHITTTFFENFVILKPFLADSFITLNPSMSSDWCALYLENFKKELHEQTQTTSMTNSLWELCMNHVG